MKRQGKHISKFLRDPLPDPEIPADDAWAGMNDMLDNGPASTPDQIANGQGQLSNVWKAATRFKGLLIGVSAVVTLAVVALIVLNAEIKNNKHSKIQTINPKITESATVRPDWKIPAPEFKKEDIFTPGSPSETTSSEITPAGTPPSKTGSASTTSANTTASATKGMPPASASVGRGYNKPTIPEDERIKTGNRRSENLVTNPRRTRMSISPGPADVTRIREAHAPTGSHTQERTTFSGVAAAQNENERATFLNTIRQNDAPSPINPLNTGQAAHQEVPSFSHEENKPAQQMSLNSLQPLAGHFEGKNKDLSKAVQTPAFPNAPLPSAKTRNPIWRDIHFGPEWNLNRAVGSTEYMFAGADSVKHPWRLAIPGLFVSKSWNRHSATFIFNPLHTYFGEKERVAQRVDTMRVTDSIVNIIAHNTNFIKAFGINFSLQYQYQATPWISLVGGLSYARYSAALLRKEMEFMGNTFPEAHLAARGRETLKSYIRPQQWSIRVGVLSGSPQVLNGRLQFGLNVLIPVSNLSLTGFKSVKSPNVQGSLRFLIK